MSDPLEGDPQLQRWRDSLCGAGTDVMPATKDDAAAILDRLCAAEQEVARLKDWRPIAIKWFRQLGEIAKAASIGGDVYADTAGAAAWAATLLERGAACKPPMPLDWEEAKRRSEAALLSKPAPSPGTDHEDRHG